MVKYNLKCFVFGANFWGFTRAISCYGIHGGINGLYCHSKIEYINKNIDFEKISRILISAFIQNKIHDLNFWGNVNIFVFAIISLVIFSFDQVLAWPQKSPKFASFCSFDRFVYSFDKNFGIVYDLASFTSDKTFDSCKNLKLKMWKNPPKNLSKMNKNIQMYENLPVWTCKRYWMRLFLFASHCDVKSSWSGYLQQESSTVISKQLLNK